MRYPASEKLEIIRLVEQSHLPARRALQQIGIPRSTFYRWCDLYRTGGPEALDDRSPRPDRVWNRIPNDVCARIVTLALDETELSPRELTVRFTDAEGAIKWTRLSCCSFAANAVRLQLHALACNFANVMRTLALPEAIKQWSLTSLRENLVKIGAKVVHHSRYVIFQMAEVTVPKELFQEILRLIADLRLQPPRALA